MSKRQAKSTLAEAFRAGASWRGNYSFHPRADLCQEASQKYADSHRVDDGSGVLTKHAKVGGVRFHPGCSTASVIEAAYRHYEHEVTPEFEAHRIQRAGKLRQAVLDRVYGGRSMNTAPKDGKRVLIHARCMGYDRKASAYAANGDHWVECWFHDGRWQEWCGTKNVTSTGGIDPVAWMPLPCTEDMLLPRPGQAEEIFEEQLLKLDREIDRKEEVILKLQAKFREFADFVSGAPVGSGVCCCGGDMSVGHHDDHAAVDQWDHSVGLWMEEINGLLPVKQE